MSSDNYKEEVTPLFKHLRTEAFRFIIVRYNHYSLIEMLENELKSLFPTRQFTKVNAHSITFSELSAAYYAQENGFFWIENFDFVLQEKNEFLLNNLLDEERRNQITAGLNLRRDTFAKKPIALFVFLQADNVQYARVIMNKMPDLWSFRTLMLDLKLKKEITVEENNLIFDIDLPNIVLEEEAIIKKKNELSRLEDELNKTDKNEIAYISNIYIQMVDLQTELGLYGEALKTLNKSGVYNPNYNKGVFFMQKGDVFRLLGNIKQAESAYKKAIAFFKKENNSNSETVCLNYLGIIEMDKSKLNKAKNYFKKANRIQEKLYKKKSSDLLYKNNLASSYLQLGVVYSRLNRWDIALNFCLKNSQLMEELCNDYPEELSLKNGLTNSYLNLGRMYYGLNNMPEALSFFEKSRQMKEELYTLNLHEKNTKLELVYLYILLGNTYRDTKNNNKCIFFYIKANKMAKELHEKYPLDASFKNILSYTYAALGDFYSKTNKEKASEHYLICEQLITELVKISPQNINFHHNLVKIKENLKAL